jgi:branched-chain amino acid transport system ATP-binding protein
MDAAGLRRQIEALAGNAPLLRIDGLAAGYGGTEILHDFDLQLGAGQALCLVGPNGAGKSTVLNAIFGFADIGRGTIALDGRDVTYMKADAKLRSAGIAYVLQDSSAFHDLSVEDNLRLGGYLMNSKRDAQRAVERIFEDYPRLADRRDEPARVLSGGERRLLEIARALMMKSRLLLVDEPSLGLEPKYLEMVFETLDRVKQREDTSILLVEQNAAKGLAFADVGYVLVAGKVVMAGLGSELLNNPAVGRLFLGSD